MSQIGVIQEQGFVLGQGLGFKPINEDKKEEDQKKEDNKK